MMSKELFDKYFLAGINDVYIVDECYSCIFMVSDNARAINKANIGHLFGKIQERFRELMVLTIARLFDERSDVYSIPTMVANAHKFPLQDKEQLAAHLTSMGVDSDLIGLIVRNGFSPSVVEALKKIVPTKKNCPELGRLINMRNKEIAHRDNRAFIFERPAFKDVKHCSQLAKDWITCFSDGVRGGRLKDRNGDIAIFDEALGASRQMRRIFQMVYAIPADEGFSDAAIEKLIAKNRQRLRTAREV